MNILCIGDIFAQPGREALQRLLPGLRATYQADLVIVNGENAAGGRGITAAIAEELLQLPIDILTSGNHIWQHPNIAPYLRAGQILRPANAPADRPGAGLGLVQARNGQCVAVMNLQGQIHMHEGEKHQNPFLMVDALIAEARAVTSIIIVDFHAEITSEKKAFGYHLDGKVSCMYGTHTHIQTADERILPHGTAYITDIGMTGAQDSVIGVRPEDAIRRFVTAGAEKRWKPADGQVVVHGICVTVDPTTGRATKIIRVQHPCT